MFRAPQLPPVLRTQPRVQRVPRDLREEHEVQQPRRRGDQAQRVEPVARERQQDDGAPHERAQAEPAGLAVAQEPELVGALVEVHARDDDGAEQADAQAGAVEPPLSLGDGGLGGRDVGFRQGGDGAALAVVGEDEAGDGGAGDDEGHDEGDVGHLPDEEEEAVVPADGVGVEVEAVHLEVDAVHGEGLEQAEDGLGEEVVHRVGGGGLVEERDHRVAEHEGDERVVPAHHVLHRHAGDVFEFAQEPGLDPLVFRFLAPEDGDPFEFEPDDVDEEAGPDEGVTAVGVVVDAADPESHGHDQGDRVADEHAAYHGHQGGVDEPAESGHQGGGDVERDQRRVRVAEEAVHVDGESDQTGQHEDDADPSHDVFLDEPRHPNRNLGPKLPAHEEGDGESEEAVATGLFGSSISREGNDSDVDEIDEQFVSARFMDRVRSPQQAFVVVLPEGRLGGEGHGPGLLSFFLEISRLVV